MAEEIGNQELEGKRGRRRGKNIEVMKLSTDLPTAIIMEILSWLPLKSLLKCRYVCKTWLQIISDPHFAKLHLSRSGTCILVHNENSRKLLLYQIDKAARNDHSVLEEMVFTSRSNLPKCSFTLVNSCNGLLCLSWKRRLLYICNPVLGEYLTIKVAEEAKRVGKAFCLGFSAKTNQYKILHTFYQKKKGPKAELYTIGTGSWRSLGNALSCIYGLCYNTFLHAALHWVDYFNDRIVCFDFEDELFREVPTPPEFFFGQVITLILGVIEDSLCACYRDDGSNRFEIWVMSDYGVKESWTRRFLFKNTYLSFGKLDYFDPLHLKNGRILMSFNDKRIVCYNLKRKRFTETEIYAKKDNFRPTSYTSCFVALLKHHFFLNAYTPCFVSLNDVAKGENITRVILEEAVRHLKHDKQNLEQWQQHLQEWQRSLQIMRQVVTDMCDGLVNLKKRDQQLELQRLLHDLQRWQQDKHQSLQQQRHDVTAMGNRLMHIKEKDQQLLQQELQLLLQDLHVWQQDLQPLIRNVTTVGDRLVHIKEQYQQPLEQNMQLVLQSMQSLMQEQQVFVQDQQLLGQNDTSWGDGLVRSKEQGQQPLERNMQLVLQSIQSLLQKQQVLVQEQQLLGQTGTSMGDRLVRLKKMLSTMIQQQPHGQTHLPINLGT